MAKLFRLISLISAAAAMALSAIPAHAQFRGLLRDGQRGAQAAQGCEKGSTGDTARGIVGGLLGGAAGRTARRAGLGQFVPVSEFTDQLSAEIACKLNEQEQKQAADATVEATRGASDASDADASGPPIGQTAAWVSGTRGEVTGSSTVTAREQTSSSEDCITVTDVIIVEGEETRAEKRMCRFAGSARYSIAV